MHSLKTWRMLPPGGAPLPPAALRRGVAALRLGEQALEAYRAAIVHDFGVPYVFFAGSGKAALAALFMALRRKSPQRDQVLVPAYVSFSVPSAVVKAGCRVSLYDLEPETLAPRPESLGQALSDKTLAVIACHQFGYPFDPAPFEPLCRAAGAVLVDDAAQAMGATVNGRRAGCLGDVGLFSHSRTKPLTAVAGGVLLTADAGLAELLAHSLRLKQTGPGSDPLLLLKALGLALLRRPEIYRLPASLPRLGLGASVFEPEFTDPPFGPAQAGLAAHGLAGLSAVNQGRRGKAALYTAALRRHPQVRLVRPQEGACPIFLRFPVLPAAEDAGKRTRLLNAEGRRLGISPGFPLPLQALPPLSPYLDNTGQTYPGAEFLARNLITLPTHDQVTTADCRAVLAHLDRAWTGATEGHA